MTVETHKMCALSPHETETSNIDKRDMHDNVITAVDSTIVSTALNIISSAAMDFDTGKLMSQCSTKKCRRASKVVMIFCQY